MKMKRYDLEHANAVNYVSIHPQLFNLDMRKIQWLFKEGIWAPTNNSCDYAMFPDFVYLKQDGTGGALEVKHNKGLRRHALEQIVSASNFFKEVHNTKLTEASIVYYENMPYQQELLFNLKKWNYLIP